MEPVPSFVTQAPLKPQHRFRHAARRLVAILLILALAAVGYWYSLRPSVVVGTKPVRGPAAEVIYATGFVEPQRPVEISSRVTAPVNEVLADEGDQIFRGQPLARLDAADLQSTIAQLAAQTLKAEQDEARALTLFRQGWLTKAALDLAVATANSARAAESSARAKFDQYTIRSGISGTVLRRDVEPGDLATAAKTLFEIGNPRLLRVTATVDERDIPLVQSGAEVMMSSEAYPGRVIYGRVYQITPGGDPDQRAFRVRIRPTDTQGLPIGLTLEVNIVASKKSSALLVPASAVRQGSVWTVSDGRARRVRVATGIRGAAQVEVTRGLTDASCIIAEPPDNLSEGQRVTIRGC